MQRDTREAERRKETSLMAAEMTKLVSSDQVSSGAHVPGSRRQARVVEWPAMLHGCEPEGHGQKASMCL
jgi:hypothetical protein